jgi:hypothetical protein
MKQKHRLQKKQNRKLWDLDDHLYFLKETLAKLVAGDEAYLKPLAAELRVLVCEASRTEGLLWRIIDELQVPDTVHVHLPCDLNREHPLAQGVQFIFYRISHGNSGGPGSVPADYSLKEIIKECEALVVLETGYSHEKLIRAVAEQMGSAHEDEGVERHLVELSSIIVANRPVLVTLLMRDAELVLEVGERVLAHAAQTGDFVRKIRPAVTAWPHYAAAAPNIRSIDFECASVPVPTKGTIFFTPHDPHPEWWTNSNGYDFGMFTQGTVCITTKKHPDKTIQLGVEGLADSIIESRKEIPATDKPWVTVVITWDGREVNFFMCGVRTDSIKYQPKCEQAL